MYSLWISAFLLFFLVAGKKPQCLIDMTEELYNSKVKKSYCIHSLIFHIVTWLMVFCTEEADVCKQLAPVWQDVARRYCDSDFTQIAFVNMY